MRWWSDLPTHCPCRDNRARGAMFCGVAGFCVIRGGVGISDTWGRGFVDEGRPVAALKYGVKHWTHGVVRGPAGEGARTVEEFLGGLDYVDERELVGKI